MGRYRKKPVEIEAVQLTWQTWQEVCEFMGEAAFKDDTFIGGVLAGNVYAWGEYSHRVISDQSAIAAKITTLEGTMIADENDWIIRGIKGELYPCKPDIFDATYERVED